MWKGFWKPLPAEFEADVGKPQSERAEEKFMRSNMRFISDIPPQGVMFLSLKLNSKSLMFVLKFYYQLIAKFLLKKTLKTPPNSTKILRENLEEKSAKI